MDIDVYLKKGLAGLNYFLDTGYLQLYHFIYGSPQFPLWTSVQALWCLIVLKRSTANQKTKRLFYLFSTLIISFVMTFCHREILALILGQRSPVFANPVIIYIFLILYILIFWMPGDIFPSILDFPVISYFIGFFQGLNQMRLFTLILRNAAFENKILFALAFCFSIWESIIFQIFRLPFLFFKNQDYEFESVPMCSFLSFYRTIILYSVFWFLTHKTPITPQIGLYKVQYPAIIISTLQGIFNSAALINFE